MAIRRVYYESPEAMAAEARGERTNELLTKIRSLIDVDIQEAGYPEEREDRIDYVDALVLDRFDGVRIRCDARMIFPKDLYAIIEAWCKNKRVHKLSISDLNRILTSHIAPFREKTPTRQRQSQNDSSQIGSEDDHSLARSIPRTITYINRLEHNLGPGNKRRRPHLPAE